MGYYDEGSQQKKRNYKKNHWFSSLVSGIAGGLIVLLLLPTLSNSGLLPYHVTTTNANQLNQNISSIEQNQQKLQKIIQMNVQTDVTDAVEKVQNSIVGVINIQQMSDFFNRDSRDMERGTGSGVIYEKINGKAHIVTNYHVIDGAKQIEISLANGERVSARLVGADPLTDLAVLEIDDEHVEQVAEFGDSDVIRPGEPAIAIGNPLGLEFSRTVTQGIISAKERSLPVSANMELNVIQTDAAINPGNSGGALINIQGQVIGINSLKISQQGIEGLGFAIPINDVIPIIHDLVRYGEVKRPFMGIELRDLVSIDSFYWQETLKLPADIKQGIVVARVASSSPAEKAGLKELDVIVDIDGIEMPNGMKLRKYLFKETSIGETIKVKVYRQGLPITMELELGKSGSTQN